MFTSLSTQFRRERKRIKNVSTRIRLVKNWHIIVWPLSRMGSPRRTLELRDGMKFVIRDIHSTDFNILIMLLNLLRTEHYGKLPQNGVIFDIGSHIGIFSVFAAKTTNATVYAFEPVPENYELLKENIRINNLEGRIIPCKIALGDKNETREMSLHPINTGGHRFLQFGLAKNGEKAWNNRITVTCKTLDDFLEEYKISEISLIKCDVEGAEYDIFFGASPRSFSKIRRMAIEMHQGDGKYTVDDLSELFKKNGFRLASDKKYYGMPLILADRIS